MLVMAVDVGTSSARARCFDASGVRVPGAEAQVGYATLTSPDGAVELDADAMVEAIATAVDGCLTGCGGRAREIAAVGASVFWHSLLALDGEGVPLTRVLTWADTRSADAAAELRRALDERAAHARTGAPLHSSFFPAKLRWLRRARPDIVTRAQTWCGFAEYLYARLTGELRQSLSMASGTGLVDQRAGGWDPAMLDVCEIGTGQLPPIDGEPARGLVAEFAARWPPLARVPWFLAHGDGACSNMGSDCSGPDRIALNVGTSAALRLVSPVEPGPGRATPWGLWRYRVDDGRSLIGGATSEGGNVLAWCRAVLALPESDEALNRAIARIPADGHGLTALPFLAGERSVGWHGDARAALEGLSLATTAPAIVRALMEAVAYRLALIYERLSPLADGGHEIVASGGALTHGDVWPAIIADVLGAPLTLSSEPEASVRGAALLALAALGAPAASPLPPGRIVSPDPRRHEIYRAAMERQRLLYDNLVGPRLS
jgi:gluconokinase